ncbi:MAG: PQQ-dependent sugar dehydrogenase, partial [Pseudomonadota bacterium]
MHPLRLIFVAGVLSLGFTSDARALDSSQGMLRVDAMVTGLDQPWAVGFLPGGAVLITERDGRLIHVDGGTITNVRGVPDVAASGQGGLLDVLVPRDFAQTREIYLSFSAPQGRGAGTALARGVLSDDASRLLDVRTIFEMAPGMRSDRHFGSRIVEGRDGHLYLSIGDRGERPSAQDLSTEAGSIVRVARDGSVPADNPFVGQSGIQPEIWSYGHRNPQGMTQAADGAILTAEHGARGGDEVNAVRKGANF